ncbi:MAG: hypothetical protein WC788_05020 [Candidatus Paceibacterota bacterium]|jgi:nucleoside 2-deoxyribosyltransferase
MRIYFAAPYTNLAIKKEGAEYGWTPDDFNKWLENTTDRIEEMGHEITIPHRDYHGWGKTFPPLRELFMAQYKKITDETDLLLAYIGDPQSGGVCIEIGYAIRSGIPVIIIKRPEEKITLLAHGLNSISKCEIVEFESDEDLIKKLKRRLTKY